MYRLWLVLAAVGVAWLLPTTPAIVINLVIVGACLNGDES